MPVPVGPPWALPLPPAGGPPPARVDVLVLGASLAALAVAAGLAEGGAAVVLLGASPQPGGVAARDAGLVRADLGEHPHRLLASVGPAEARAMHVTLARGRAALRAAGLFEPGGSLHVGAMPGEGEEIVAGLAAARALVPGAELWSAARVAATLRAEGLAEGRHQPDDGTLPPGRLVGALLDRALAAGVHLALGAPPRALDTGPGVRVQVGEARVEADVLVIAEGWRQPAWLPVLDPWVHPVRHAWIATAPVAPDRLPLPVTGQHGFLHWRSLPDGRVLAGGARFATPHLEVGETDEAVVAPRVAQVLAGNLARVFPDLAPVAVTHTWAAIATHTCDGLPLVGPLPGRADLVACTGFHGLDSALALPCAEAVVAGLLGEPVPALPRLFSPRRLA